MAIKKPYTLTFAFKNCNTVTVTLEMQNMIYGNCQLSNCNAWCELALSKKQSLSSCFKNPKPIFPFQKL